MRAVRLARPLPEATQASPYFAAAWRAALARKNCPGLAALAERFAAPALGKSVDLGVPGAVVVGLRLRR